MAEKIGVNQPYDIYLFTCSARKFMEFASVSRRIPGPGGDDNAYQRLLTASRLKTIGEGFIDKGGFANNIIVKLNQVLNLRSLQKILNKHYSENKIIKKSSIDISTSNNSDFWIVGN